LGVSSGMSRPGPEGARAMAIKSAFDLINARGYPNAIFLQTRANTERFTGRVEVWAYRTENQKSRYLGKESFDYQYLVGIYDDRISWSEFKKDCWDLFEKLGTSQTFLAGLV